MSKKPQELFSSVPYIKINIIWGFVILLFFFAYIFICIKNVQLSTENQALRAFAGQTLENNKKLIDIIRSQANSKKYY